MPKTSELTLLQRSRIEFLHEEGKSQREIARIVKCSRGAVEHTLKRFAVTGSHENRPKSGRKKVTSLREDRDLIRSSLRNRKKTSSELAAAASEVTGRQISARTVRRRLLEAGLKGCKARKKPWLSKKNIKKRLEWAQRYKDFTEEDWSKVVWSDESNFQVSCSLIQKNSI